MPSVGADAAAGKAAAARILTTAVDYQLAWTTLLCSTAADTAYADMNRLQSNDAIRSREFAPRDL